jgi:glycosyltransferase involved in cell wall biosynthesis
VKSKILIVCRFSPHPVVTGGCERLVADYQTHVFADYDVWFLHNPHRSSSQLLHYGELVTVDPSLDQLRALDPVFALFFNPIPEQELVLALADEVPSFCFVESYVPSPVYDRFLGAFTHSPVAGRDNVLVLGGSFDPAVFRKDRQAEEAIVCVARICSMKNQLELVHGYRERIYERFGLPLQLVGGPDPAPSYAAIAPYIDGEAVRCTTDPRAPRSPRNWLDARQIASLLNRARLFVNPSPAESFCLALVEAMACGTTCVVNGAYDGFLGDELRKRVHGHTDGKRGSILDLVEQALEQDVRIDASLWAQQYALPVTAVRIRDFIETTLEQAGAVESASECA